MQILLVQLQLLQHYPYQLQIHQERTCQDHKSTEYPLLPQMHNLLPQNDLQKNIKEW